MKNFNYLQAVTADVIDYIRENINATDFENREELAERLNDDLWIEDSVTGNASGSYTFNAHKAKEFVFADPDTVSEALREFCVEADEIANRFLSMNWEYFDVTARCFCLCSAIEDALDELEDELVFADVLEVEA